MFQRLFRSTNQNITQQSVREIRDNNKAGWSRTQKRMFQICLGGLSLKFYSHFYQTQLIFTFTPTQENIKTVKSVPSLARGVYQPTFYLPTSFLQALYGSFFDPVPYAPFMRQSLVVDEDGGTITLDHMPVHLKYTDSEGKENQNMRVLVILHGLTGASECNYIRQAALLASRKGFRTVCINLRGYSHSKLTTPYFTDFTQINDVDKAIEEVNRIYPNSSIYALAYSMGANQLIRYLESDSKQIIKAAVAISVPWNILELSQIISKPSKFVYDYAINRNFKRNLLQNAKTVEQNKNVDVQKALETISCNDYDEFITRRMFGFDSVEKMYSQVDCTEAIKNIKVPMLILSSKKDPIIDQSTIPKDEIAKNKNLIMVQTNQGGHIEWFTGAHPVRWIHKSSLEYLIHQDNTK